MRFFATTAKEMEELLARELETLGAKDLRKSRAGVAFSGTLETAYRVCLWSRIASRVLLPLKVFPAPAPEKLYGGVKSIRWSEHLDVNRTLAVDFTSSRSQISHTHYGALKVKDAIVDQFRSCTGERPSVNPIEPDVRINVHLNQDEATVSLDLSGDSLHRRGYREQGTPAPLKENLAAAILAAAGWTGKEGSFMDAMCGSGTLPIEAALIAADTAPGLHRRYFGFLGWKGHDAQAWDRLLDEARQRRVTDPNALPRIVGFDRDFRAVRVALANVERAGLRGIVHIERREFEDCAPVSEKGTVVLNPPYGERIGGEDQMKTLYSQIGDVFKKRFTGWEGYVFTGNPELAKCIGLRAARRTVLYNGAIECRLLRYALYSGSLASAAPAV